MPVKRTVHTGLKLEPDMRAMLELPCPAAEFISRCLTLPQKLVKVEDLPAEQSLLCDEEPISGENLSTLSSAASADNTKTFACSALYKQHEVAVYTEILRILESI